MGENGCKRGQRGKSGLHGTNNDCQNQLPKCDPEQRSSLENLILNPKTNKIPRPPNAFMIYAREHRKLLALKYPRQNNKNISALLGEAWKKIEQSQKAQYFEKAKMLEEMHRKRYPGYVYSPRVARIQKQERLRKKNKALDTAAQDKQKSPEGNKQLEDSGDKDDWNAEDLEIKSPCSDYVPNNPQFFESQSLPKIDENSSLQYDSGMHSGYTRFPHSWPGTPKEATPLHYSGRYCDDYEIYSRMFSDQPYQRCPPSCSCNYQAHGDYDHFNRPPPPENMYRSCSDSRYSYSLDCSVRDASHTPETKTYATLSPSFRELDHQASMPSIEHPSTSPTYSRPVPSCSSFGQYRGYRPMYYAFPRTPWNPHGFNPSSCHYRECFRGCCNNYSYPTPSPYSYPQYPSILLDRSKKASESLGAPPTNEHSIQEYEHNEANSSDTETLNVDRIDDDEENTFLLETENSGEQEERVFQQM